jgi:hypothetical protein
MLRGSKPLLPLGMNPAPQPPAEFGRNMKDFLMSYDEFLAQECRAVPVGPLEGVFLVMGGSGV